MTDDKLLTQFRASLRSASWENQEHRASLRGRLEEVATCQATRSALRRHPVVIGAVAVVTLLTGAGFAAYQLRHSFFLRGMIGDQPTTIELPVDDEGNVRLIFTDEEGTEHELIVRPEDVDEDGVIRDMKWHLKGPPKGQIDPPP
ncbi:MAG: hypothetical protein V3T53_05050 [Phycisphaerales bacterium]